MRFGIRAGRLLLWGLVALGARPLSAREPGGAGAGELPWEVWRDLRSLARIERGDQVLLRSSHDPTGDRFDRHSDGDSRFIRIADGEGVIFEASGTGAITRIWMTQGEGVSLPLDPSIQIRFYFDGEAAPRIDLPLPSLFDGTVAPFLEPLVGDRLDSSGGNFSYVPLPFRAGCRVTLLGAESAKIWFQFTYHLLPEPSEVITFTGGEDLSEWIALFDAAGGDPWTGGGQVAAGSVSIPRGTTRTIYSAAGAGFLNALLLQVPAAARSTTVLTLRFDGQATVQMPVSDFFAIGRGGATPTRSALLGEELGGMLYCYFPLPFQSQVQVELTYAAVQPAPPLAVSYQVRRSFDPALAGSGTFGAVLSAQPETTLGVDFPLLDLTGQGKWVGLFADLSSVNTLQRTYLEGDERIYLDDSPHPMLYGTGVEDLFGGGFYFDQGPFTLPLHGMTYHLRQGGEDITAAYRLMLSDAPTFANRIRAGMEVGPMANLTMRARSVAYYYRRAALALALSDTLDLGSAASRQAHHYLTKGAHAIAALDASFEGVPTLQLQSQGSYREPGVSQFMLTAAGCGDALRLRRRLDAGFPDQGALVFVNGELAGSYPHLDANPFHRWREIDLDLPAALAGQTPLLVSVVAIPIPGSDPADYLFSEFRYQLWCGAASRVPKPPVSSDAP
ncbi:MAG TPA: DUF2961 domain-containing protein [Acidobacteriota bacterium]